MTNRLKVLQAPAPADTFAVSATKLPSPLVATGPVAAPSAPATGGCAPSPSITLDREGDRIVRIRVQCGCGQMIELDCGY